MAPWLVRSTPGRAVRVWALAGHIELCSWYLQLQRYFIKWYETKRTSNYDLFASIMAVVLKLWINLTFCNVYEQNKKTQTNPRECAVRTGNQLKTKAGRGTGLGRVVGKLVNSNPGLKVNRSTNFSCWQLFSTSYFLFNLRLLKFKSERQKYKQKTSRRKVAKLRSKFSLILGFEQPGPAAISDVKPSKFIY